MIFRSDAGFSSRKVITTCVDHNAKFSIAVTRQPVITRAIGQVPEDAWVDIG